jgi:SAM-dependent methyltransferase
MNIPPFALQIIRRVTGMCVKSQGLFRLEVESKVGLEIGGPSGAFRDSGVLPLYRYTAGLDNCVFAVETLWEGRQPEGQTFSYHPRKSNGFNFVRDATDLRGIADHAYDYLLSSHNLEHIANPVRALKEWMRVVKPGGAIIVILPDYRHTFDHRRQPTAVRHMMEDYESGTSESDLTHLQEILELHDRSRDREAGTLDHFHQRSLRNFENRTLHHHVFDEHNSRALFEMIRLSVETVELVKPWHIAILSHCPSQNVSGIPQQSRTAASSPD